MTNPNPIIDVCQAQQNRIRSTSKKNILAPIDLATAPHRARRATEAPHTNTTVCHQTWATRKVPKSTTRENHNESEVGKSESPELSPKMKTNRPQDLTYQTFGSHMKLKDIEGKYPQYSYVPKRSHKKSLMGQSIRVATNMQLK